MHVHAKSEQEAHPANTVQIPTKTPEKWPGDSDEGFEAEENKRRRCGRRRRDKKREGRESRWCRSRRRRKKERTRRV